MKLPVITEILSEFTRQEGNRSPDYTTIVKIESKAPLKVGDKLTINRP